MGNGGPGRLRLARDPRATRAWPVGAEPYESPADSDPDGAFSSTLTVVFDDDPTATVHRLD